MDAAVRSPDALISVPAKIRAGIIHPSILANAKKCGAKLLDSGYSVCGLDSTNGLSRKLIVAMQLAHDIREWRISSARMMAFATVVELWCQGNIEAKVDLREYWVGNPRYTKGMEGTVKEVLRNVMCSARLISGVEAHSDWEQAYVILYLNKMMRRRRPPSKLLIFRIPSDEADRCCEAALNSMAGIECIIERTASYL